MRQGRAASTDSFEFEPLEQLEPRALLAAETLLAGSFPTVGSGQVAVGAMVLSAPSSLQAASNVTSVSLSWTGNDSRATSLVVLRSSNNGQTFTTVATIARTATTYRDTAVVSGTAYQYKVRAIRTGATPGTTAAASVSTKLLTPTSLVASISGAAVSLRWTDPNRAGMGYVVQRSTDGTNFSTVATLAANSAKTYVDRSVAANTSYVYRVMAKNGPVLSNASNTSNATTPDGTAAVTIATRYTNELVVTSLNGNDTISVSASGGNLSIVINGQTFTKTAPAGGLFIYNRGGADSITIQASVNVQTTITCIGDGVSTINSGISTLNAWLDTTDQFIGSGVSHFISSFAGGVSKALGVSMANPSDAGAVTRVNKSLFGSGPIAADVAQGSIGDCYFLASLAGFAAVNTSVLINSAADLGDGTYVVQFKSGNTPVYVRVNNQLSTGGFAGLKFAHDDNTIWAPIMEKAWAYFRTRANTYASISGGWMTQVYSAFGVANTTVSIGSSEANLYNMASAAIAAGKAVTFGTSSNAPNLVRGHAYTLISVSRDSNGIARYVVRNPWGSSGTASENSSGYATLTFAQLQSNFGLGAVFAT